MLRKLISLHLVICLLLCLSACKTKPTDNNGTNTSDVFQTATSKNEQTIINSSEKSNTLQQTISNPPTATSQQEHIHNYVAATCTTPKTCACGITIGKPIGHQYSEATCTTPKICINCNIKVSEPMGHSWKNATCENPKTCLRCSLTEGIALGHNYNTSHICTRCDLKDPLFLPVALSKIEPYKTVGGDWLNHQDSATDIFGTIHNDVLLADAIANNANVDYTYRINQKYIKITGSVFLQKGAVIPNSGYTGSLKIYGDGNILYSVDIPNGFETTTFTIDVSNVKDLRICLHDSGLYGPAGRGLSNVLLHPVQ